MTRRQSLIFAALTAVLFAAHTWIFRIYITDDAFIAFRYLDNWIDGNGLVYNAGDRVWGFTSFLWIVLLAPFVKLGADPLVVARVIGVACNIGTLALVWRGLPVGTPVSWRAAATAFLVCHGAFVLQALGGLETSLFTLLVTAAVASAAASAARSLFMTGTWMALATLCRPEGLFLFPCLLLPASDGRPPASRPHRAMTLTVAYVPVVAAFVLAMWSYYGSAWPNSIDAKVGLSGEQFARGLHYALVFVAHYPMVALIVVASWIAAIRRRLEPGAFYASVVTAAVVAITVAAGGDWMPGYRLLHVLFPLAALLLPVIARQMRIETWLQRRLPARAAVLAAVAVGSMAPSLVDRHVRAAASETYVNDGIVVGRWMRENLSAGSLLATNTGGTIAYYSKLRVVDMLGINDRTIAHRRDVPAEWKGIEKGDGTYVLSREPDYIQFGSSLGSMNPVFLSDIELYLSDSFWRGYELKQFQVGGKQLALYERRARSPSSLHERPGFVEFPRSLEETAAAAMVQSKYRY